MNPLIAELIAQGLIDNETAQILARQFDAEFERESVEQEAFTALLDILQQQQAPLISAIDGNPGISTPQLEDILDAGEDILVSEALPTMERIASQKAIGQVAQLAGDLTEEALSNTFNRVNEEVIGWANDYYLSLADDDFGSLPNLNKTSREQFLSVFNQWNRGQLPAQRAGDNRGLPTLIDRLQSVYGPERAERIATTEVTRIFGEATEQAGLASSVVVGFRWDTANDELVCPICEPLDGLVVRKRAGASWEHPDGKSIRHPAHTRCRCSKTPVTEATMRVNGETFQ